MSVVGALAALKGKVKAGLKEPYTEGVANRLHYKVTAVILFSCCLLVTCLEWVGNGSKISCVLEGKEDDWTISAKVINTYCFILKTFSLPRHYNARIGSNAAHVGVGEFNPSTDETSFKAYYQWVPFVLFFQGWLFCAPHMLFKTWEGGKVSGIIAGLHTLIISKEERRRKQRILSHYFVDSLHTHNLWAIRMLFVEVLNLINVIGNIYFVDVFLGGEFSTYGMRVLSLLESDPENRIDPMATVFPRVTKCSFYKYGPSGTIQTHDAICVLPINILNEKIYVFLWFWFILLSAITVISLLYHVFFMITPAMTKMYLKSRTLNQDSRNVDEIGTKCEVGDWKLLYLLSRNMEPLVFGEFLKELHAVMREKEAGNNNEVESSTRLVHA